MSFAIDVNVLLYASDKTSGYHQRAVEFLKGCASGGEVFCLAWITVMGYLRISTHPAIFSAPLGLEEAMQNIQALLLLPQVRLLFEDEDFWDRFHEVSRGLGVRGNLVPDAHLAALLKQEGIKTLYTNDTDFRKFSFLQIKNPFEKGESGR